jgi:hypothetical protein
LELETRAMRANGRLLGDGACRQWADTPRYRTKPALRPHTSGRTQRCIRGGAGGPVATARSEGWDRSRGGLPVYALRFRRVRDSPRSLGDSGMHSDDGQRRALHPRSAVPMPRGRSGPRARAEGSLNGRSFYDSSALRLRSRRARSRILIRCRRLIADTAVPHERCGKGPGFRHPVAACTTLVGRVMSVAVGRRDAEKEVRSRQRQQHSQQGIKHWPQRPRDCGPPS